MKEKLIIGSRGSALALKQVEIFRAELAKKFPELETELKIIKTTGDVNQAPIHELGGKEVFIKEIDFEMLAGNIDIAVHSLKDIPAVMDERIVIGAVLQREDARDTLLGANSISEIPQGAKVGTSSPRRAAQLKNLRPDLEIAGIRGNVQTRIDKLNAGDYDCIILATAGLKRLGMDEFINPINEDEMIPAGGQAAIAITCLAKDLDSIEILKEINHQETMDCIEIERKVIEAFEGDCFTPIAVNAKFDGTKFLVNSFYGDEDGKDFIKLEHEISANEAKAKQIGLELKQKATELEK